jgi:hypothetical protein
MLSDEASNVILLLFIIIIFSFAVYIIYNKKIEAMTNPTNNNVETSHSNNSTKFADNLKTQHSVLKDKLNISKYRNNYENIIIEMNDYIDSLMLNELLNVNPINLNEIKIMKTIENINKLSSGKQDLNKIMKHIDNN